VSAAQHRARSGGDSAQDARHASSSSADAAAQDGSAERWPPGVSRTPIMSIGQVVALLTEEFPAMTVSKLRYLEDQDLVTPHRSPSGYRKYSRADVERLRYALTAQRDAFLPLRVIRDQLDDLDAGRGPQDPVHARVVAREGQAVAPPAGNRLTAEQLCDVTGATLTELDELAGAGVIAPDARGRYLGSAAQVVIPAVALGRLGVDPRHLRTVRQAAEREAGMVQAVVAPLRVGRAGVDLERAHARQREMGELYVQLHAELLRRAISDG
jgi:DNA-binding transcriptional MerR regulator